MWFLGGKTKLFNFGKIEANVESFSATKKRAREVEGVDAEMLSSGQLYSYLFFSYKMSSSFSSLFHELIAASTDEK